MRYILRILLVFGIIYFSSMESRAQFEGAVWDTLTSDTLQDALSRLPFAATPSGLHLAYAKSRGMDDGWSVHYRFFSIIGGWDDDVIVEAELPAYSPSIAAKEFGAFKITIFFDANDDVYGGVVSSPWDTWEIVNYTTSAELDREPTVAVDDNGDVHVAWITYNSGEYKITYGKIVSDTLAKEILQESDLGQFGWGAVPKIVVVNNLPHIFYRGVNEVYYHIHHAYKQSPESPWEIEYLYSGNVDDYTGSATVDDSNDIHLAMSGNDGWGFPGKIYYSRRNYQTGEWTPAQLATGSFSTTEGSVGVTDAGHVYIASSGISGNFYTGDIYLSNNSEGSFHTELLTHYEDGTGPSIVILPGSFGALVMQGIIGEHNSNSFEIIYYGPASTHVANDGFIPHSALISSNYPNPFNALTTIKYSLPKTSDVTIDIYDILGRKVETVIDQQHTAGCYQTIWNAAGLTSGIYFYKLQAGDYIETKKMVLLK